MANGKPITNDRLYESLNAMRLELKGDLRDLRTQFDTLEAGRLTRLESKYQDMQVDLIRNNDARKEAQAILSTKFVVLAAIAIAIFNSALYGIFTRVFAK